MIEHRTLDFGGSQHRLLVLPDTPSSAPDLVRAMARSTTHRSPDSRVGVSIGDGAPGTVDVTVGPFPGPAQGRRATGTIDGADDSRMSRSVIRPQRDHRHDPFLVEITRQVPTWYSLHVSSDPHFRMTLQWGLRSAMWNSDAILPGSLHSLWWTSLVTRCALSTGKLHAALQWALLQPWQRPSMRAVATMARLSRRHFDRVVRSTTLLSARELWEVARFSWFCSSAIASVCEPDAWRRACGPDWMRSLDRWCRRRVGCSACRFVQSNEPTAMWSVLSAASRATS